MHTGAPTILRHFLEIVLYAFAILVVAIPTTVWLLAFVGLLHANKDPSPGTRLVRAIARLSEFWARFSSRWPLPLLECPSPIAISI